jgi:hypothetical protein
VTHGAGEGGLFAADASGGAFSRREFFAAGRVGERLSPINKTYPVRVRIFQGKGQAGMDHHRRVISCAEGAIRHGEAITFAARRTRDPIARKSGRVAQLQGIFRARKSNDRSVPRRSVIYHRQCAL